MNIKKSLKSQKIRFQLGRLMAQYSKFSFSDCQQLLKKATKNGVGESDT